MNRGTIPGFYYDEEKKKYFKIQPNHVAPAEAKYSKSTVKREQRESKRRKLDARHDDIRRRQTVRPSSALTSDGVALGREIGNREPSTNMLSREAFFLSQLQPSIVRFSGPGYDRFPTIVNAHITHGPERLMLAVGHSMSRYPIFTGPEYPNLAAFEGTLCFSASKLPAFSSPVISIDTTASQQTLVICAQRPTHPGNVLIGFLDDETQEMRSGCFMTLGSAESSLWACAMNPWTDNKVAIAGTEELYVVDTAANSMAQLALPGGESRAITWLDPNTVVYGQPPEDERPGPKASSSSTVHLWDVRSQGTALRFTREKTKGWKRLPITGLQNPCDSGLHILASYNKSIDLYDTRVTNRPLLSFKHTHQGPQLQFATYNNVVAALDEDNDVQTYSLRSGKRLGTLQRPPLSLQQPRASRGLMTNLQFHESDDGLSMLFACRDEHICKWTFGGARDDEWG